MDVTLDQAFGLTESWPRLELGAHLVICENIKQFSSTLEYIHILG